MFNKFVVIIFGGISNESLISIRSTISVVKYLYYAGHSIKLFFIDINGTWIDINLNIDISIVSEKYFIHMIEKSVSIAISKVVDYLKNKCDVVFPLIHGNQGEDGTIQGFLDIIDVPYVGCDLISSVKAWDKSVAKIILDKHNIPVVPFLSFSKLEYTNNISHFNKKIKKLFLPPFFIKPSCSGSSIGVRKINDIRKLEYYITELFQYDNVLIIEKAIEGKEIEMAIIGSDTNIIVGVPSEIAVFIKENFFSYDAKYLSKNIASIRIPAIITDHYVNIIKILSKKIYAILNCNGMARVDFFISRENAIYVNEVNTIPGFTVDSLYIKMLYSQGVSYISIINLLIKSAIKKKIKKN